jgi:hypothetical protein
MERGSLNGNFEKKVRLYLIGNVFFETRKICKRRLWKRASLSTGAPLRNLEGRLFYLELRETDEGRF